MLAAGMGSSRTASRRGIAAIDFGKVEPESRVREAVAAAVASAATSNAANQAGDTALHVAAALGHDTVVQLLAEQRRAAQREEQARHDAAHGGDVRFDRRPRTSGRARRRRFDWVRAARRAGASEHRGAAEETRRDRVAR